MNGVVNLFGLTEAQFETFVLVLVRVSVMLFMLPIFQSAQVNTRVRFALGLAITFVVWHVVPPIQPLDGLGPLTAAVFRRRSSASSSASSRSWCSSASSSRAR